MTHSGDDALQRRGQVHTWVLPDTATRDGRMFRRFRVLQTGLNSNKHRCVVSVANFLFA